MRQQTGVYSVAVVKRLNIKGEEEEEVRNRVRMLCQLLSVRSVILSTVCVILSTMCDIVYSV